MSGRTPGRRGGRGRLANRFGVRLGLILTLALAPVGIIALVQTAGRNDELRARTEAALAGATLRASAPKLVEIAELQAVSRGLSLGLDPLAEADCAAVVRELAGEGRRYTLAAIYNRAGQARCSSTPGFADVAAWPFLPVFLDGAKPALRLVEGASPLLVALTPVFDAGGAVSGFAAVGQRQVPPQGEAPAGTAPEAPAPAVFLYDSGGNILGSTVGREAIPGFLPDMATLREHFLLADGMFPGQSESGTGRVYSANTLIPGEIHALGVWPERAVLTGALHSVSPFLLPALTWAICLLAAWAVSEMMVTRHMRRFRRAITSFAQGDRRVGSLAMASAPTEIREAADAFEHMTETIVKDEADLENSVREKEALLREVHHRVKNNLQLMASIINMQLRRTRSDDVKRIIRRLQDRMLSLATVHNGLFHTASMTEVRVDTLLSGIVDQVVVSGAGAGQRFHVETGFDPLVLSPEQVVPLALLLTEVLGRALRSARGEEPHLAPSLRVTLRAEDGGAVRFEVVHLPADEGCDESDHDDEALGTQLIHGFTLQLGGIYRREADGRHCVQRVDFRPQSATGLAGKLPQPQG